MKKYPELTRETAAFIEGLEAKNDPPLYTLSYQDARACFPADLQPGSVESCRYGLHFFAFVLSYRMKKEHFRRNYPSIQRRYLMKKYPELTRETAAFIEGLEAKNDPPLYTLSYQDARAVLAAAQSGPTPRPEADVTDFEIPFGEGGAVELRIVRPKGGKGRLPVVFYIHGGGWVMGDKNTHDRLVREIAVRTGAAVVFVNYTPSPEAQYPVPLRQIMTALRYIVAHADELKLDAARIAVAGDSVGGNMAAALTLMCKAENGPRLRFQLLLYPVTDASLDTDSYREFADGPWLTKKAMEYFWDAYAPDKKSRREITASPLLATAEQLKGLPPAFVITDANDVLRDEGEAYAVRLMQAGVPTGAARYAGTIHDFLMLDAVADTIPAKAALAQACGVLREALAE